jgi:hypothetical protein
VLQAGTLESHIIASRVYWAEFDMPASEDSPLLPDDPASRATPVGGVVRFA